MSSGSHHELRVENLAYDQGAEVKRLLPKAIKRTWGKSHGGRGFCINCRKPCTVTAKRCRECHLLIKGRNRLLQRTRGHVKRPMPPKNKPANPGPPAQRHAVWNTHRSHGGRVRPPQPWQRAVLQPDGTWATAPASEEVAEE